MVLIWSDLISLHAEMHEHRSALDSASPFQCNPPFSLHSNLDGPAHSKHTTTPRSPRNPTESSPCTYRSCSRAVWRFCCENKVRAKLFVNSQVDRGSVRESRIPTHRSRAALAGEAWRQRKARACSRALKVYYCVFTSTVNAIKRALVLNNVTQIPKKYDMDCKMSCRQTECGKQQRGPTC